MSSTNKVLLTLVVLGCGLVPIALVSAILGGYFVSVFTSGLYGGTISEVGGVTEQVFGIEAGIFFFSSLLFVLIVVLFNVSRSNTPQASSGVPD